MICTIEFPKILSFIQTLLCNHIGYTLEGNRFCLFVTDEQAEQVRRWLVGIGEEV